MTFRKLLVVSCLLGAVAGCGNYSNEDLEFMAALPEKPELSAEVPTRSALMLGETAEYYRLTRNVSLIFNGITEAFLGLIDTIRALPPTTRQPNRRIWGPVPAKQEGWMVRMVMDRAGTTFTYDLEFQPVSDPGGWLRLIHGTYAVTSGVRHGVGQIGIDTKPLRAAGADPGLGFLDYLTVDYTTSSFPIDVKLTFANFDNPLKPSDPKAGHYEYAVQSNGQGALSYDFFNDSIPGPVLDELLVTSRWLGTGEGRADLQVVSGDAFVGAEATECWDRSFRAVYIDKPWAPLERTGTPADCAAIPTL
ncbi:MAG TPA: hypothetical protein VFH68_24010 [Polyangia bacterium]|nr:hypothetical protein [Polyangia bacterium]